jgi:hypothetical protein
MAVTTYDGHSDGEDMPNLVVCDDESNDGKQSQHRDDEIAFQQISDALLKYRLGNQEWGIDIH